MGRLLYIDCFAGIAGDMMLGALVHLGPEVRSAVEEDLARLPLPGFHLRIGRERRGGIEATRVEVVVEHEDHPHRAYGDIRTMLEAAPIRPGTRGRALEAFGALAVAEGRVHGRAPEEVCFHEVGAVDSIVDIVGVAAGLAHLDAEVWSAPVPLGRGFVRCQHGPLPLPAPATLELLEGVPVQGTHVESELVTPTGAAILRTQASGFGPLPAMRPRAVGWGAGSRDHADRPGLLRLVLGETDSSARAAACVVVEANVDDMTAEVAAHAMERALAAGALDAWVSPITMKKGRPAMTLSLLVRRADLEALAALLMAETTTIGLRFHEVGRMELPRRMIEVDSPWGPLPVKVSGGPGGPLTVAPEFEACRKVALEAGVPLKEVLARAAAAALSALSSAS